MSNLRWLVAVALSISLMACAKKETTTNASPPPPAAVTTQAAVSQTTAPAAAPQPAPATAAPAATAAAAPSGIATADGEQAGVQAVVQELKRTSGGMLSLKFTITNGSKKRVGFGYDFGDPDHSIADFGSIGGVQLIDQEGKKKYFVVRDSDKKCVCSRGVHDIDSGEAVSVWAKFPAPADSVQKISIVIPHFSPLDDVPISR